MQWMGIQLYREPNTNRWLREKTAELQDSLILYTGAYYIIELCLKDGKIKVYNFNKREEATKMFENIIKDFREP
jgi:hypothetical protein